MLDIVLVNWNSGDQLRAALSSIAENEHGLVRSVSIVDNASTDESADRVESLATTMPFALRLICNSSNRGFAAACNQGAKLTTGGLLLFLNPDTRIFDGSLSGPVSYMSSSGSSDVGVVGIQLVDETGRVARSCARFPSLGLFVAQATGLNRLPGLSMLSVHRVEWDHESTAEVDHVIGAFYLIRRDVFESLGGFDERFFVYLEDVDLSYRTKELGYRIVYLADAKAYHEGGGASKKVKATRLFYSLRSRLLYGFKHFRPWEAWLLVLVTMVIEPVSRTIVCLVRQNGMRDTWRGYGMLYRDMPSILRTARRL